MEIKEISNYMLKKYNQEIIETYFDSKKVRKNRIKSLEKLNWLKSEVKNSFEFKDLITDLKVGPPYNCTDNPWIQVHNLINSKGTKGEYIGISFNKKNNSINMWLGFGRTGLKKNEVIEKRENYITRLKTFDSKLQRGFKYGSNNFEDAIMINKEIRIKDIIEDEIKKDFDYLGDLYLKFENSDIENNNYLDNLDEIKNLPNDKKIEGRNIIFVGAPGSGKSFEVRKRYLTVKNESDNADIELINNYKYETVVFYPEYSNANFVGSILPVIKNDNKIKYEFVPGPFSIILKRALTNQKTNFYLIIEELNRGNAAAIFGDIFVLLDRKNGPTGESTYKISNANIADYVFGDANEKIYIPDNLSIIATMNSSDQNTIPIDSAFTRRWEKIYVVDSEHKDVDDLYIKGFGKIKWGTFRKKINLKLENLQNGIYSFEDKKLCAYFIDKSYLSDQIINSKEDKERFINNVLIYLYDEVCKYEKTLFFDEKIKSIDKLIATAQKDMLAVFNDEMKKELLNE